MWPTVGRSPPSSPDSTSAARWSPAPSRRGATSRSSTESAPRPRSTRAGLPSTTSSARPNSASTAATGDDLIAACGSLPPGTDSTFYARLAEAVAEPGRRLAVDTSGAALHACLDVPLLVAKPNRAELEELVEDRLETYGDLVDVATDLVRRGWSNVLVSLGGSGAVLVNRRGAWVGDAPISTIANTVGAGDAALTGFLCEPAGDDKALASALAFGRATVAQVSTAGAIVDEADRAAVRLRPVDATESLGEETG